MTMKVVYIAGPYRGRTPWDVETNIRKAEAIGLEVARMGFMPLIPHTMTRFFDKQCTSHFWIEGTLELLARCDAMIVLPGWENSDGTKGEIALAEKRNIPYFWSMKDLGLWRQKLEHAEKIALETTQPTSRDKTPPPIPRIDSE